MADPRTETIERDAADAPPQRRSEALILTDGIPSASFLRRHAWTIATFVLAGAAYIALGVWEPRFLLSWTEGVLFAFLAVWALPAAVRRLLK